MRNAMQPARQQARSTRSASFVQYAAPLPNEGTHARKQPAISAGTPCNTSRMQHQTGISTTLHVPDKRGRRRMEGRTEAERELARMQSAPPEVRRTTHRSMEASHYSRKPTSPCPCGLSGHRASSNS